MDDGRRGARPAARADAAVGLRRLPAAHRLPGRPRGGRDRRDGAGGRRPARLAGPATGRAKGASSTWLNGRPVEEDLRAALGREVRTANDADCFAVSEARDGAGRGHRVVLAVILGSGAGAGIAVGGRAHHGPNNSAGEWGHNPLPFPDVTEIPGAACYCGRHGCLETLGERPRVRARLPPSRRARPGRAGRPLAGADRRPDARRRPPRRARLAALRRPRGARAVARRQRARPRRARAGRRHVERGRAVRRAAGRCSRPTRSRPSSARPSCGPRTATRAACAAPRGCGRRTMR